MPQTPIYNPNIAAYGAKSVPAFTAATLIKAAKGTLLGIQVLVAGSAPGTVNDVATLAGVASDNEVATIPNSVGAASLPAPGIPCLNGIVVTPGTGQTLAVFYI
jgi:hypothetical protein